MLEIINKCNEVSGYKISLQKSIMGDGGGGGGRWVQLGWGGGMGRKGIQL